MKVLLVDDDIVLGNIATLALQQAGYEVHFQTSLYGIVEVLHELNPHIIVLDVEIGDKDGMATAPDLLAEAPDTPILFISSHTDADYVVKSMQLGAVGYLKKPFDVKELIAYVGRFASLGNDSPKDFMAIGEFKLLHEGTVLLKDEVEIKRLTPFEYKLLCLLAKNRDKVVTREAIEAELWGSNAVGSSEYSLNNYIIRLRKLLALDERIAIIALPKVGYKLVLG
ncbi:MAG: response regulator transcription factor [Bacteroides sp.]|nr:response regulator transcription factor [Bacteroides sp.]